MADGIRVTVEGTDAFKAKLEAMRAACKGDDVKEISRAGAKVIADKAASTVHVITGNLRDSIRVEDAEDDLAQVVAGGINGVDYAADEEYGNSHRPPHPYMRPAVDSEKSHARAIMRAKSYALIKKAIG